jgi:hypothetical protein
VIAEGTPEQVAQQPESFTGQYLGPALSTSAGVAGLPVSLLPREILQKSA